MKKTLLSLSLAFLGMSLQSKAQVIWTENFDAAAMPSLPSGWSEGSTGTPGWKTSMWTPPSGWGTATGTTISAHSTQVALIDDWNDSTINHAADTFKSQSFSLTGYSNPWLNLSYFFYNATRNTTGNTEYLSVLGSTNGGATWTILDSLSGNAWSGQWGLGHVDLSPLASAANAMIAFRYTDGTDHLLGAALDSVEVTNLTVNAASCVALGYNSITNGVSANGQTLQFLATNNGLPITSLKAKFTINGTTVATETFSSLTLAPYSSQAITFTGTISGAVAGTNTVVVTITEVNGVPNTAPDSTETSTFVLASGTTQREGLIEEFSSSTCAPCKSFNQDYDPLMITLNANNGTSHLNVLKYQMNWPNPGNDRSYNADGQTRRTYYGVNSIPKHLVNGALSSLGGSAPFSTTVTANLTNEANNSHSVVSYFDMAASFFVDTARKKMGAKVSVTPKFTKTGSYSVRIAIADKHYQNTTNTTGQLEYYHVMRKMLPSASGHAISTLTDGVAQTFWDTGVAYTFANVASGSSDYPVQNDNKFWDNPRTNGEMIAFIQNESTKAVMQAVIAFPNAPAEVSTMSHVTGMNVFPNPATTEAHLQFNLGDAGTVAIKVVDLTGKLTSEVITKEMTAGAQDVTIPTGNLAAGNYFVIVTTGGGSNIATLTVGN